MGEVIRLVLWFLFIGGGIALGLYLDSTVCRACVLSTSEHVVSFILGMFLMGLVMVVSKNTGRILSRYGRVGDIPRMKTNRLVKVGPYGCMRHPMHFGLMFFPLSVALITGSFSFIFIVSPVELVIIILLVGTLEEHEAISKFGEEYMRYKETTPFFSLRLSCLKLLFKSHVGDK